MAGWMSTWLALIGAICFAQPGLASPGVRLCGRRLADLLNFVCERHGGFHAPRSRRDGSEGGEAFASGVVDECCRKKCSLGTLVSYCADARHVNLDELMPALSSEELQQDEGSVSKGIVAAGSAVPDSRPNLGQFRRTRPIFIVLSQLPEDEERALGDYRF